MPASPSDGLVLRVQHDESGKIELPARPFAIVLVHAGKPVHVTCRRAGRQHSGLEVHGDIEIVPIGTPCTWEMAESGSALVIVVKPDLLNRVAEEAGHDPKRIELQSRFQARDPQLESIGWALRAEMEAGYPTGKLFLDSLSLAFASRLIQRHSSVTERATGSDPVLGDRRLRQLLGYIEDHLERELSLIELAAVAGVSVSHCKMLFRRAMGVPIHQYVIRRRVEKARQLLSYSKLSISQVALETGFSHQSHLARHMRRVLGESPASIRLREGA